MYLDTVPSVSLKHTIAIIYVYQLWSLIVMTELGKSIQGGKRANLKANLFIKKHFQFHVNLLLKSSCNDLRIPCAWSIKGISDHFSGGD